MTMAYLGLMDDVAHVEEEVLQELMEYQGQLVRYCKQKMFCVGKFLVLHIHGYIYKSFVVVQSH